MSPRPPDQFVSLFGSRRGQDPTMLAAGEPSVMRAALELFSFEHARFRHAWDNPDLVTSLDFHAACAGAVAALTDINRLITTVHGRPLTGDDLVFSRNHRPLLRPDGDGDGVRFDAQLGEVTLGWLWLTSDSTAESASRWELLPEDFLIFDDDPDGELTAVPLLSAAESGHAESDAAERWMLRDRTIARARRLASDALAARARRRVRVGAADLLSDEDRATLRLAR